MADARDALIAELLKRNEELGALVAKQQNIILRQQALIESLERRLADQEAAHKKESEQLRAEVKRLEREILGPKSEKLKVTPVERDLDEPTDEERAKRREQIAQKRRENALAKKAALEVEETKPYELPKDQACAKCSGGEFKPMGFEESSTYEYKPARFVRRIHKREKRVCSCGNIEVAKGPPKLVVGGQYGFGFAAFLVVDKCADSIPIYRIENRFARLGIPISRATMNEILHQSAEVARPLVERLERRIAGLEIVLADETSIRLQDRQKRGFIWVFHGQDDVTEGRLVLYVFAVDRSGETPARILGGSSGTLVVDGYTGYNNVTDPAGRDRGGCWCHLRRKLFEARQAPGDAADVGIKLMRPIFRVEHEACERRILGTPAHLALRAERSKPAVENFFAWAAEQQATALPQGPLGAALGYAERQRSRLELFLSDARIPPHNNASERLLRSIALGRKNYLFVGHPRAGRNLAGLYSLVGSCIANKVEPTEYLTDVLPRIREASSDEELDALLPDRWEPLGPAP